jgi:hypothetical protein
MIVGGAVGLHLIALLRLAMMMLRVSRPTLMIVRRSLVEQS